MKGIDQVRHKIAAQVTAIGKIIKQGASGGSRYAWVVISVAPSKGNDEPVVESSGCKINEVVDDPEVYLAAVVDGIREYIDKEDLVQTSVTICELRIHPTDSNPRLFKQAAGIAMKNAVDAAGKVDVS